MTNKKKQRLKKKIKITIYKESKEDEEKVQEKTKIVRKTKENAGALPIK